MAKRGYRPLDELGPAIAAMGYAAAKQNSAAVKHATNQLKVIVAASGRRYHIRGRTGGSVPLEASANVREFSTTNGGAVFRGKVTGIPEGFWAIVEYGSGPHIITSRKGRPNRNRLLRAFAEGESFGRLKPVRTPYGPRQFVHHPGHRSFGKPWASAMKAGGPRVAEIIATDHSHAMAVAFTTS